MTNTNTASVAADQPDALIERLEDAVYEWGNYVDEDHAPRPLTRHVDPHIKAIAAELQRLRAALASHGQAPASKIEGLTAAQESLGVEFEKVLHDNLFDLYEESAPHGQAPAQAAQKGGA